jgi:hypothetical protein
MGGSGRVSVVRVSRGRVGRDGGRDFGRHHRGRYGGYSY